MVSVNNPRGIIAASLDHLLDGPGGLEIEKVGGEKVWSHFRTR